MNINKAYTELLSITLGLFFIGVKTMQLSSDRRPVLGVPSYTYGSTHHFRARSQDTATC